jgi:hypothetical protein
MVSGLQVDTIYGNYDKELPHHLCSELSQYSYAHKDMKIIQKED